MHTQQLTVNQIDTACHNVEHTNKAIILAEIAERLKELKEQESPSFCCAVISKLYNLQTINHESLWMTIDLLTGDMAAITQSYASLGREKGRSKQAHQQAVERVLKDLQTHYPQLAEAFIQLRSITAQIPSNKNEP